MLWHNSIPTLLFSAVYSSRFFGGNTSQLQTGGGDAIPTPTANTWSEWSGWTECSKTCEEGRQTRMRTCITEGQSILDCSGRRVDIRSCNKDPCPGENGTMLVWITQHPTFRNTSIKVCSIIIYNVHYTDKCAHAPLATCRQLSVGNIKPFIPLSITVAARQGYTNWKFTVLPLEYNYMVHPATCLLVE